MANALLDVMQFVLNVHLLLESNARLLILYLMMIAP